MTLIDTSAWIHSLRPDGDPVVSARVKILLESGEAAWCALVQLELWNGARGERERHVMEELAANLPSLAVDDAVWSTSCDLARKARAQGHTVPATDLIIAGCACRHGVALEHADAHLEVIGTLIRRSPP
ncbi:MAG: PIN domain-containing protein [Candidatus Latescibacteria bacterium]|nr:PIN domain-containing protein [Candidatus Latescibacterota bacterium]MDP7448758.1 PIN domain-containing protein [Candidatus Latescibacterota bacterium]HJP33288.1 PIN domain-containing protein [Candidatus Latescibacterota bacterium]